MADFGDKALGNACQTIIEQVEGLPFLSAEKKEEVKGWLRECAEKAEADDAHTATVFNKEVKRIAYIVGAQHGREITLG